MNYYLTDGYDDLKAQRAAAVYLFRHALQAETGIINLDYMKDERGKPYIPGTNLHVSISHSKAGIACVIAEFPVGIDIEEVSRMKLMLARKICTPAELAQFDETECKQDFLCRLWTLKEANYKICGKFALPEKHYFTIKKGDAFLSIAAEKPFEPQEKNVIFAKLHF